ncbi:hypothetical protein C7M84_006512 [Penaeus vannamei]|uniref:Uncharacterized protein n=1 Tax=Penaeus vannamei TaxID=6689 RepID=A0A3R7QQX9_PENVA|nr:hypothetical protein C7M84_006512 [Penaeus vannamei]
MGKEDTQKDTCVIAPPPVIFAVLASPLYCIRPILPRRRPQSCTRLRPRAAETLRRGLCPFAPPRSPPPSPHFALYLLLAPPLIHPSSAPTPVTPRRTDGWPLPVHPSCSLPLSPLLVRLPWTPPPRPPLPFSHPTSIRPYPAFDSHSFTSSSPPLHRLLRPLPFHPPSPSSLHPPRSPSPSSHLLRSPPFSTLPSPLPFTPLVPSLHPLLSLPFTPSSPPLHTSLPSPSPTSFPFPSPPVPSPSPPRPLPSPPHPLPFTPSSPPFHPLAPLHPRPPHRPSPSPPRPFSFTLLFSSPLPSFPFLHPFTLPHPTRPLPFTPTSPPFTPLVPFPSPSSSPPLHPQSPPSSPPPFHSPPSFSSPLPRVSAPEKWHLGSRAHSFPAPFLSPFVFRRDSLFARFGYRSGKVCLLKGHRRLRPVRGFLQDAGCG